MAITLFSARNSSPSSSFSLPILPAEILKVIFSYLPKSDLIACSLTSKEWKRVSDAHTLWLLFAQNLGLSLQPSQSPKIEYGRVYETLRKDLLKFEVFGECYAVARKGDLLYLKQRKGIKLYSLIQRKEILFLVPDKTNYCMSIFHEYLILTTQLENQRYKYEFFCLKSSEFLFSCIQFHQFLISFVEKNVLIYIDENRIILRRLKEIGVIIFSSFHQGPLIHVQKNEEKLTSIDSCLHLKVLDLSLLQPLFETTLLLPSLPYTMDGYSIKITLCRNELVLLKTSSDAVSKTTRLSEVFLGDDEIYLQFRSTRKTSCIAVFKKTGTFTCFSEGDVCTPGQKILRILRKNEKGFTSNVFSTVWGNLSHSSSRLLVVSNCIGEKPDLYDLKNESLLDRGILYYSVVNRRLITLKENELCEWDDLTAEKLRSIPLLSVPTLGKADWSNYSNCIEDEDFRIEVKAKRVTLTFTRYHHEPLEFEVEDPKRDIQTFDGRVALLTSEKKLYLSLFGRMSPHPQSFQKITSYGKILFCYTEKERFSLDWTLPFPKLFLHPFDKAKFESFTDYSILSGKVIKITNWKIDIWNVEAQDSFTLDRTFDFPIEQIILKNEILLEIFIDPHKSNGMIIWNLNQKKAIHLLAFVTKYLILEDLLITWDKEDTIQIWDLEKGVFLTQILKPRHFSLDQVYYALGAKLITHSGKMSDHFNFEHKEEVFLYSPY